MSAFMCSDAHTSALVNAAVQYGIEFPRECTSPAELFALLVVENAASLRARYGRGAKEMGTAGPHRFVPALALPPVHVMKLAQSYAYQSCEHDGWKGSTAARWIDTLIDTLICRLPEYEAAPWTI